MIKGKTVFLTFLQPEPTSGFTRYNGKGNENPPET